MYDPIKPDYYKHYIDGHKIEVIDIIESWELNHEHCLASAIQYILRSTYKEDRRQDIKKAIWFLQHWLEK